MKARILLGSMMAAGFVAMACSSSDDHVLAWDDDAGADGGPAPNHMDAGAPDASDADAMPPTTARPLEVSCTGAPCYVAVSGNSGHHFCGLLHDGTVRCWGRDTDDSAGRATATPVAGLSGVTQISVGPNYGACARTSDGSVYCWGKNDFGQLGRDPAETQVPNPQRVEGLPSIDRVELGNHTACAIGTDRALYCWGETPDGIGIDPFAQPTMIPQKIPAFGTSIRSLAVGTWETKDTVVVLRDGDVLANAGEAPVGETSLVDQQTAPREVAHVSRAGTFAYLTTDGRLQRWQTYFGTLSVDSLYVPTSQDLVGFAISGANLNRDEQQGAALLASGRFFRWGSNTAGTLGVPPQTLVESRYPLEVDAVKKKVVSFATTYRSTCVSLVDGTIQCWGSNAYGELGRGSVDLDPHPEAEAIH